MRKGHIFEHEIDKVLKYVNSTGGFATKLHANRTIDGIFLEGEPFDYIFLLSNYHCVFDSKECASDKWSVLPKDIKQIDNLKRVKNAGLEAYLLIYFKDHQKVLQIDVDDVIEILQAGSKSIGIERCKEWELLKILKS